VRRVQRTRVNVTRALALPTVTRVELLRFVARDFASASLIESNNETETHAHTTHTHAHTTHIRTYNTHTHILPTVTRVEFLRFVARQLADQLCCTCFADARRTAQQNRFLRRFLIVTVSKRMVVRMCARMCVSMCVSTCVLHLSCRRPKDRSAKLLSSPFPEIRWEVRTVCESA
jgi:hypothetical protein